MHHFGARSREPGRVLERHPSAPWPRPPQSPHGACPPSAAPASHDRRLDRICPAGSPPHLGVAARGRGWVENRQGLWALARNDQAAEIGSIGYAQGWEKAKNLRGVVTHDGSAAVEGVKLYNSAHAPAAILMDMRGETLHRWQLDYADIPDAPARDDAQQNTWRRVRLLEDGSLLASYAGRGLLRIDRESRLLWHLSERVHNDLALLPSGRILLFDNLGASDPQTGPAARILEYDPLSESSTWQWRADRPSGFYSLFCGTATRLARGNTLVTETGNGRAFELDPDGHIVWDFHSPHRAGADEALLAGLFEVQRLPLDGLDWLER